MNFRLLMLALAVPGAVRAAEPDADPALLLKLGELEARVDQLEQRNASLEAAAKAASAQLDTTEAKAAHINFEPGPVITSADGRFSFRPHGALQADLAFYHARSGGYDYSNGTDFRRVRMGMEGTAFTDIRYRIEAEMVKKQATLVVAYLQYPIAPRWTLTLGQTKVPFGLEGMTSDVANSFLERGMANSAIGSIGAEKRMGVMAGFAGREVFASAGLFGASEEVVRDPVTPDEPWGINGRIAWEPGGSPGHILHLGISGYRVANPSGQAINVAIRPGSRADGSAIESFALRDAGTATYLGTELALVRGPFNLQAEYGRVEVARLGRPSSLLTGGYVYGGWFLTGQSRTYANGNPSRMQGLVDFDPALGHWGAVELLLRYDRVDFDDPASLTLPHSATSWTGAVNWYLNANTRLMLNYIRFRGTASPLAIDPAANGLAAGDTLAGRVHFDF